MKKVKLGEVCEILNGFAFKSSLYVNEGIRIIRITNVQKGYIEDSDPKYYPIEYTNSIEKYILKENDLLMSLTGNVGRVGLISKTMLPAALNQRVACLRTIDSLISKEYVFQFLNSDLFEQSAIRSSNGVAQKNLSTDWLKKVEITYPSVEQQELITSTLNLIERLICCRKKQNKKFNELVKSRFNEMFGDFYTTLFPKYKIGEKFELSSGSTPSRDNKLYWDSGTINWVKTTEVINKEITETEEKITKFALENTSLKLFPVNTILIAMYGQGQTRGRSAILKVESTSNQACGAIFPNKIDNPVFIWHQLMLRYSELRELGRGGNQPNLNGQLIKNFELILPPLSLQNEFADFVAQVDKSQLAIQKSLEELETLKKSLMQEYFG